MIFVKLLFLAFSFSHSQVFAASNPAWVLPLKDTQCIYFNVSQNEILALSQGKLQKISLQGEVLSGGIANPKFRCPIRQYSGQVYLGAGNEILSQEGRSLQKFAKPIVDFTFNAKGEVYALTNEGEVLFKGEPQATSYAAEAVFFLENDLYVLGSGKVAPLLVKNSNALPAKKASGLPEAKLQGANLIRAKGQKWWAIYNNQVWVENAVKPLLADRDIQDVIYVFQKNEDQDLVVIATKNGAIVAYKSNDVLNTKK